MEMGNVLEKLPIPVPQRALGCMCVLLLYILFVHIK